MNASAARVPPMEPTATPKVLVVEDDVLVRLAAADYLRGCGFVVLEAVHVDEAVNILRADSSIDVVFADVRLPGGRSGIDLTLLIQRDYPDVKVLLTSGVMRGEEASFTTAPLIRKPYFLFEVERRIRALLDDTTG